MSNNCSERVFLNDRSDFGGHMCRNKATVLRDGKWYCKIHDPEYVNIKRAEQSRISRERYEEESRVRVLRKTAVNACKEINPDNPQVVAENIGAMYKALDNLVMAWSNEQVLADGVKESTLRNARQLLDKLEVK